MAKYTIKGRENLGRVWAEPHVAALEEAAGGDAVADEVPRR